MNLKPVVPRRLAGQDVIDAVDYYRDEVGAAASQRFVNGVEEAFGAISQAPSVGSPRFAIDLDLPGLRTRRVRRFPYLIFYVERADEIDVWRVLHERRDIPAELSANVRS